MNTISRRSFLGGISASFLAAGCATCPICGLGRTGKSALQLYSIRKYIEKVGLAKALEDVAAIGYRGVEFIGFKNYTAKDYRKMLADAGLVACGTHVNRDAFSPEKIKASCEFNLAYGNSYLCCPGGGNIPPGCNWSTGRGGSAPAASQAIDDFTKRLCDYYNTAAETAKTYGCRIGLHNHTWEHGVKMLDGSSFWDYFFSHTSELVCMEQDVGWSTCAGVDPCVSYVKYPHRSPTLHAKENGMGPTVKTFDAILGQPGKPDAKPVDWDRLVVAAEADGVEWWVVECERHFEDLSAVTPSYAFLAKKGIR